MVIRTIEGRPALRRMGGREQVTGSVATCSIIAETALESGCS